MAFSNKAPSSGCPTCERVRFPVWQEIHRAACFDVDEHGSVDPALALGIFVNADHTWRGHRWIRQRGDQPQEGVPADLHAEGISHPSAGPSRERETDRNQRRSQPLCPPTEPTCEPGRLLGKRLA
ncbi:hypothetical protein [Streptomyces sp. LN245]|uniref:hypothetical protein n=1 Tax=Streptomyces sp. LN245 TaxID=3112975 RepID=UPI0037221A88